MKQLNDNWLTEGTIDFEHKKYVLLDFVQQTDRAFQEVKLYPALSEWMRHYSSLEALKEQKTNTSNAFPQKLIGFDPSTLKLQLEKGVSDNAMLSEVMEIIEYALPVFRDKIKDGQDIYNFIESQITMESIGVEPLNMDEGYLLLHDSRGQDVLIYGYSLSIFENSNERYRALKTEILGREKKTIGKSFEQIKLGLIKRFREIPNPSTWLISSDLNLPLVETFLPITKRLMMQKLHMRM
jgi:hypothetical protein